MERITFLQLAASLNIKPADFTVWMKRNNEPVFQDYSKVDALRIIDKYIDCLYKEAMKYIILIAIGRSDDEKEKSSLKERLIRIENDDVEEIRRLADFESFINAPMMQPKHAEEQERKKNDVLRIEIGESFFKK